MSEGQDDNGMNGHRKKCNQMFQSRKREREKKKEKKRGERGRGGEGEERKKEKEPVMTPRKTRLYRVNNKT